MLPPLEAEEHGIRLGVVKHPGAKKGFVLLPRKWTIRFRRFAKDYERLPRTVAGLHSVAFVGLLLHRTVAVLGPSP